MLEHFFFQYTFNKSRINKCSDTLQKTFMSIYQAGKTYYLFLKVYESKVRKSLIKGFMITYILTMSISIFIFV